MPNDMLQFASQFTPQNGDFLYGGFDADRRV
jgi:hypothetical protein